MRTQEKKVLILVIAALCFLIPQASAAAWHNETVESAYSVGEYSSLDLDSDGDPHISYYNSSSQDLKYAWKDAGGWHSRTVDSTGSVGSGTSLVVDSADYAHISYFDSTNSALKYAYKDAGGWHTSTIYSNGYAGLWSSIALDSLGNPRISFSVDPDGLSPYSLRYAYKDAGGWHTQTADGSDNVGSYNSLVVRTSDNMPGISYYDALNGALKYAWKDAGGWHSETVDSPAGAAQAGLFSSLVIDSEGYPHISYKTQPDDDLKHAWKDAAGWHTEFVDFVGFISHTSIDIDGYNNPHISYYGDGSLKHAWKKPSGSWEKTAIDSDASVGQTSLALDSDNYPRISYYDSTHSSLKYAWMTGNRAPAPLLDTYTSDAGVALTVPARGVLENDIDLDGDTLTSALQNIPGHGTVNLNTDGSFTYQPDDGFTGDDLFTYLANDGSLSTAATVIISVLPNARPVAKNDYYSTWVNTDLNVIAPGVLANDTDSDGDTLSAILKIKPTHGKVTLGSHGSFKYSPKLDYSGLDSFSYVANDSHADSNIAVVSITVKRHILPLPGFLKLPTDPDGDGIYEDLNGNDRLDFADIVLYFNQMEWIAANEPVDAFDLNGNGRIDFADIVELFGEI